MADNVTNVVVVGLGGQGVLTASDIVADAAFGAGCDVKKSEVHGMAQRGGSVRTDVRFGDEVFSPMVPQGEAQYLVALDAAQVEVYRLAARADAVIITPESVDAEALENKRSMNVALTGFLSAWIDGLDERLWLEAVRARVPEKLVEVNERAFAAGREAGLKARSPERR